MPIPSSRATIPQVQEQPWTEEEAFQQTGSIFFSADKLTEVTINDVSDRFNSYFFSVGTEFVSTIVLKSPTAKMAELKVWEEPDPDGFYILGIDPAFGENENNDRSSIQVCRAYADCLVQVAEYASPLVRTEQLAWIIACLMGWYGSGANSAIKYALEINGPGAAVFTELRSFGIRSRRIRTWKIKCRSEDLRTSFATFAPISTRALMLCRAGRCRTISRPRAPSK